MSWMEELRVLHLKPKLSIEEINRFILRHPRWAALIIKNALESEMYTEFCLSCANFAKCWEKLGAVKRETGSCCLCNEFLNNEHTEENKQKLRAYFNEITVILNI
ncbi:MAG: hypothetical protein NWF03_03380 [Candidatus Bathyarchaeota archaeon]|nr:hypothetical protein [Candidatus Bathyarchaeota archaeon]